MRSNEYEPLYVKITNWGFEAVPSYSSQDSNDLSFPHKLRLTQSTNINFVDMLGAGDILVNKCQLLFLNGLVSCR